MKNAPAARDYHDRTKHFPGAATAPRRIEAALIPKPYKRYLDLPAVPFPPAELAPASVFDALAGDDRTPGPLTLPALASVLHCSAGIVRRSSVRGRELAFRAASCTGALYHIELYVVCGNIGTLPAGVYHYDVLSESLRPLRTGDFRAKVAAAACDETIASAAASVVLTSTFWRNAWRYEERAYRHVFWDAGTLLANLLAVAENEHLAPMLHTAFVDANVNALLGLDARREASVAVVSLGAGTAPRPAPEVPPLDLVTEPLSRAEIEYPIIWQTHAASSLADCAAVRTWRDTAAAIQQDDSQALVGARHASPLRASLSLQEAIQLRGSSRRFSDSPIAFDALNQVLTACNGSAISDHALAGTLIRRMLIANHTEGVPSGAYAVGADGQLTLIREGDFTNEAAHLALDQPAAGHAAANLYFVANADEAGDALGERGYRAVQLEAGIRTGQVYLASTSLGLKATGLTFYDDEVASFFGLDPSEVFVLMLVVFGA